MDMTFLKQNLWQYAKRVGRTAARPVVTLYLVLSDPATPKKDKYIVYSALAYLLLPIDLISAKKIPIFGWADEAAAVALAYNRVKKYVTPAVEMQADDMLDRWFPVFTNAELVD